MSEQPKPRREPLAVGTVIANRFEIADFLGAGSFGEVYRARQLLFRRPVRNIALKLFAEGVVTSDNALDVLNDAIVLFGLLDDNPNLEVASHFVQVYDMGIVSCPGERAFMSMKLIPGKKTLKSEVYRFRHGGGMPVSLSLRYMREILMPLAWMHSLETPAIHGDLKPENVMLTDDSRLVLVDFGLAARMPLGVRGGTPAYDAPEKLQGLLGETPSDVYSVGVIWYELLTGRHPFEGVGAEATARGDQEGYLKAHLDARKWPICPAHQLPAGAKRIVPASEINRDLREQHPQVEMLLNKCLADDISQRFGSAQVLLDAITKYIKTGGVISESDMVVIGAAPKPKPDPAADLQPKTPEMRLADAAALLSQNKAPEALALLDAVLRGNARLLPALLLKAKTLLQIPNSGKAADETCGVAMEVAPDDPAVYETLAVVREAQGKLTQAAGFRARATELRRTKAAGRGR